MVKKSGGQAAIPDDPASMGRIQQIKMVAGIVREDNKWAMPAVAGIALGVLIILVLVGILVGGPLMILLIVVGVLGGLSAGMLAFGRFAQAAQYRAIEGQPGAAAAILQNLRGGFYTTPAISANRNMDVVHRTVGKPGVILVGEGSPSRLPSLLAAEKKRIARTANQIPIYDFQVGDAEGQIPIRQLQKKIMKLPRNLKGPAVADLNYRLNALPSALQMPKGPVPRSARMPKQPRPKIR
jgi:uncharacterized protein DUF4191